MVIGGGAPELPPLDNNLPSRFMPRPPPSLGTDQPLALRG